MEIIQSGIDSIVTYPFKDVPSRWLEDVTYAKSLLAEAWIGYRELE